MSTQNEFFFNFWWQIHTFCYGLPICLYRETIQWQCLPPTRYVNARDFWWRPLPIIELYGCLWVCVKGYRVCTWCSLLEKKRIASSKQNHFDVITWKYRGQVFLSPSCRYGRFKFVVILRHERDILDECKTLFGASLSSLSVCPVLARP